MNFKPVATILFGLALGFPVSAQKKIIPPGDVSRTVHGQVFFRNTDGSVRPAPFVEVHVWTNANWWESEREKAIKEEQNRDNLLAKTGSIVSFSCIEARAIEWVNVGIKRKEFLRAFQTDEKGGFSGNLGGDLSDGDRLVFVAAVNSDSSPLFVWEDFLTLDKGKRSKIALVEPKHCGE